MRERDWGILKNGQISEICYLLPSYFRENDSLKHYFSLCYQKCKPWYTLSNKATCIVTCMKHHWTNLCLEFHKSRHISFTRSLPWSLCFHTYKQSSPLMCKQNMCFNFITARYRLVLQQEIANVSCYFGNLLILLKPK